MYASKSWTLTLTGRVWKRAKNPPECSRRLDRDPTGITAADAGLLTAVVAWACQVGATIQRDPSFVDLIVVSLPRPPTMRTRQKAARSFLEYVYKAFDAVISPTASVMSPSGFSPKNEGLFAPFDMTIMLRVLRLVVRAIGRARSTSTQLSCALGRRP